MRILIINGSPKGERSNTLRLTRAFLEGLGSGHEIREAAVSRLELKPCLGCFSCWNKTPGKCCLSDDMAGVLEQMLWADLTIWSFPLYYFGMPGPLKTLMDRQLPMSMPFMTGDTAGGHPSRYDLSGKRTVVISTCGFYTAGANYDSVRAMFDRLLGKGQYEALFCGQGELFRVKELSQRTGEYLGLVKKAGAEYAAGAITAQTRRELEQLLYPREVFEAMADASWGVTPEGEQAEESLIFTRQMAALYRKDRYPGRDIILEMVYTDIGKTYRVILGAEGSRVTEDLSGPFTTRIQTPYTLWQAIAAGEEEGARALMEHKYRVEGDFDLMLQWDRYFGGDAPAAAPTPAQKPGKTTNMTALLLPWMAFWIGASIDPFVGSLLALLACALVPLAFLRNRLTLYDAASMALVGTAGFCVLLGVPVRLMMPLSYLAFGLLWTGSCLTTIPLTAHYSMNDYNGEEALANPIFVKTNRILTAAWGVLYILTAIWTWFLMATPLAPYTGAINSAVPLLMGIFTAWFQRWYPARVARG